MAYVDEARPDTVKDATLTVPATAGRVTPPVAVLTPAAVNNTVPGTVGLTAIFPKFMFPAFTIAIGVMTVADPVAVAVTCALTVVNPDTKTMAANNAINFFMTLSF